MEKAGCRLLKEPENEPIMGFRRVLSRLPQYLSLIAKIAEFLRNQRPNCVILVDYPGLNLQIAKIAKSLGIPVIYFICPQYWAWAPWRLKTFSKVVDLALVIFPFEEEYYRSHGINVRYIGHPACDREDIDPIEIGETDSIPEGEILGLLPGSRQQELEGNLPVMLMTASLLMNRRPGLVPMLCHYRADLLETAKRMASNQEVRLVTRRGGMRQLAGSARFCLVGSGTATIEVAFANTPMVVLYRTSRVARTLASYLLTVPHICQVNLMAGEELIPELLYHENDPNPILSQALPLIEEGRFREEMLTRLANFRARFFHPGALDRAADYIVEYMDRLGYPSSSVHQ